MKRKPIPIELRFRKYVNKTDTCWMWTGTKTPYGYGIIRVYLGYQNYTMDFAHRVCYKLTYGDIPDGLCVLHKCDNPPCVRPDHLFLGTKRDNIQDAMAKGRALLGELNPSNKLTREEVLEIREMYKQGNCSQRTLASIYGVTQPNIGAIVRRDTWKDV